MSAVAEPVTVATAAVVSTQDPLRRRIELPPYDLEAALALEQELGISHVLAQIMVRRGLHDPDAVRDFLDPAERYDAAAFSGMEDAVDMILGHIRAGGRIVVHGDYDVDGVCATAILVRALRALGADAGFYIPSRSDDGYGLAATTVARLATRGTALLITVDCGITAVDEVAAARAAGIDVLVTDHHSAPGRWAVAGLSHPAPDAERLPLPRAVWRRGRPQAGRSARRTDCAG